MSGFNFDLRQFNEAIFYRLETTDKTMVEVINTAARNVAYRAASFTPVATGVLASLKRDPHLLAALTSLRLRGVKLTSPEFKMAMDRFVASRLGGLKYLRSGFAPIIRAMGGTFRGGVNQKAEDTYKARARSGIHSSGRKATRARLAATLIWITDQPTSAKAASAEKIASDALQKGIDFVAADMIRHAQEKLYEAFK